MNIFNEKELIYYIDNYETKFSDKRERGSVFTNSNLINKMLNKLPKKVWKNPDLKWLDPGCGIGNFHIIVYFRLMKSLPIENEEMKRKHIIENMLFFVELNKNYIDILKNIFCSYKYNINIFHGSFVNLNTLEENIHVFNNDIFHIYFDIILGNPPFQKINSINKEKLSSKPLYPFFVDTSIQNLGKNGYLLFIHPVSWRRKSKEIKIMKVILNLKLLYIYTNNNFKEFNISAPYINYYLLQNSKYNKKNLTVYDTYFNDKYYTGKIHLTKELQFIPIFLTKETMNIFEKILNKEGDKFDVQLESKLSTSKKNIIIDKNEEFKYLNLHSLSKKNGRIFRYSKIKHPCHDKLKILMNFHGGYKYLDPFIDDGTMGITDSSMRLYIDDNNKDLLLSYFKSNLLNFLLMCTTYNYGTNQKNEFHIINLFTIPNTIDFYDFYLIDVQEQSFIKNTLII